MFHLFVDTNVLLRFYAYSDDSLSEIEKLSALQKSGQINLLVTDQVIEEHFRNRDRELAESFKRIEAIASNSQIPRFAEHYQESKELREILGKAKDARSKLVAILKADIAENKLRADQVIEDLLSSAQVLRRKSQDVELARLRRELGNPPGKKDTLGDQINWEILLRGCPDTEDLHLVSRDGDFQGNVIDGVPNNFLSREWKQKKQANIFIYKGLSEFVKAHFPDIKLPSDALKSSLIKKLASSPSFTTTHEVIAELSVMKAELTASDAMQLFQILIDNSQVNWILTDVDVDEFYGWLWTKFFLDVPLELEEKLGELSEGKFESPF